MNTGRSARKRRFPVCPTTGLARNVTAIKSTLWCSTLSTDSPQQIARIVEARYQAIQRERMQDMPMVNDQLVVQSVGFCRWGDCTLGVLITPWFMNLILMPEKPDNWSSLELLSKHPQHFPSGRYEFIVCEDEELAKYQMCSLFSPMFEFADHASAVETAEHVMTALMDEENQDPVDISTTEIEHIWYPTDTELNSEDESADPCDAQSGEKMITRRALLGGATPAPKQPS